MVAPNASAVHSRGPLSAAYDEAAEACQQALQMDETSKDTRSIAVSKRQLATVRLRQKNYSEALRLYAEARDTFQRLNEPASVALVLLHPDFFLA